RPTTYSREARDVGVAYRIHCPCMSALQQLLLNAIGVCAGYDLHLPIDWNIAERALRHRRGAGVDEDAKYREQGDGEADAEYRRQHPSIATAHETRQPCDHCAPFST